LLQAKRQSLTFATSIQPSRVKVLLGVESAVVEFICDRESNAASPLESNLVQEQCTKSLQRLTNSNGHLVQRLQEEEKVLPLKFLAAALCLVDNAPASMETSRYS